MNTRPKSQGDKSPSDKSQGGKAGNFKQQPKRTIAAATGAPRREDAMLAATEPCKSRRGMCWRGRLRASSSR
jgi:hypothetical protein